MNLEKEVLELIKDMNDPRVDGWVSEGIRLYLFNIKKLIEGALDQGNVPEGIYKN